MDTSRFCGILGIVLTAISTTLIASQRCEVISVDFDANRSTLTVPAGGWLVLNYITVPEARALGNTLKFGKASDLAELGTEERAFLLSRSKNRNLLSAYRNWHGAGHLTLSGIRSKLHAHDGLTRLNADEKGFLAYLASHFATRLSERAKREVADFYLRLRQQVTGRSQLGPSDLFPDPAERLKYILHVLVKIERGISAQDQKEGISRLIKKLTPQLNENSPYPFPYIDPNAFDYGDLDILTKALKVYTGEQPETWRAPR